MLFRSIFFYFFITLWTIFMGIICLPFLVLPNMYLRKPVNIWILGIFKLLELTCNITYEIKGIDKITPVRRETLITTDQNSVIFVNTGFPLVNSFIPID